MGEAAAALLLVKAAIWSFSLGSGTSGGVLAPLLTFGAALGGLEVAVVVYQMVETGRTCLPVQECDSDRVVGLLGLDELLKARQRHLDEETRATDRPSVPHPGWFSSP